MMDRASTASYSTSGITALFGAVTMQEVGIIIGALLGIATFLTNWHFKHKTDKREQEMHELQKKQLEANEQANG